MMKIGKNKSGCQAPLPVVRWRLGPLAQEGRAQGWLILLLISSLYFCSIR